jgi:hypothetical protein
MSGSIGFKDEQSWVAANWAYDHVMRLMRKHLPEDCSARLLRLMDESDNPLRHISLDELSPDEIGHFRESLMKAYEDAKFSGPESFASPEFYPGFMGRLKELLDLVIHGNLRDQNTSEKRQ